MRPFEFVSLFSGIGGIDLGLERAGMTCVAQSEIDPYASRVLAKHWPHVPNLGDIANIDWSNVATPDLVCGGFPCQSVSVAGRQAGQEDARWLWPEYARAVRQLRPRWVFIENVPGLLTAHDGREAQVVFGALSELGYDADWASVPAAAFGAPHLRYRVCIIAHARCEPVRLQCGGSQRPGGEGALLPHGYGPNGQVAKWGGQTVADPAGWRRERRGDEPESPFGLGALCSTYVRPSDGGRGWWAAEPDVGRVASRVPHQVDRLRCLGNAVVPQFAEWVGRLILTADASPAGDVRAEAA